MPLLSRAVERSNMSKPQSHVILSERVHRNTAQKKLVRSPQSPINRSGFGKGGDRLYRDRCDEQGEFEALPAQEPEDDQDDEDIHNDQGPGQSFPGRHILKNPPLGRTFRLIFPSFHRYTSSLSSGCSAVTRDVNQKMVITRAMMIAHTTNIW